MTPLFTLIKTKALYYVVDVAEQRNLMILSNS